ncbi:MAG: thioredoxin domain-containing protein [bacterium]
MIKKILLLFIFIIILTANGAYAITYPELNKYVYASYTPVNFNGKVLYIFEDPLCPYCHKLNQHIIKYSRESGYRINLLFKIIHGRRAFNYAVDFVCGNRTLNNENFIKYISLNYAGTSCGYGKKLVLDDISIANSLNINITPSLISTTGFAETGLSLGAIKSGLGIKK